MVLTDTSSRLFSGFTIEHYQQHGKPLRDTINNTAIIFNLCKGCASTMSCIPPSAFSAKRIRETQKDMKISNLKSTKEPSAKYFNTNIAELSPLKYNSKLMNSIWGYYNRYSPHNVKKVNDALIPATEMQQTAANCSGGKTEQIRTLPSPKLDNVWAAMSISQSH